MMMGNPMLMGGMPFMNAHSMGQLQYLGHQQLLQQQLVAAAQAAMAQQHQVR